MFKSDFLAILKQKLGGNLPKLTPQGIALPKTPPLITPSAPSTWMWAIGSIGSTYNYGDFTATNAFFWSSLNLSSYAGTDLGSTPYYIEVLDVAGKKATGYIGAVGAGETLGSETLTGWTCFAPPFHFETFITSGKDITSAMETALGQ